jgi:GAG-pre-integrase domain
MLQDMEDMSHTPIENSVENKLTTSHCKPEEMLMAWHIKLAHIPFKTIQHMSIIGQLPRSLAKQTPPKCQACMYGKAIRIPWRVKGNQHTIKSTTQPEECISVDQMESSCPGLIAQLKGISTTQRYKHLTVFVDHYTRYTYVNMQQSTSSGDTLTAKKEFESLSKPNRS